MLLPELLADGLGELAWHAEEAGDGRLRAVNAVLNIGGQHLFLRGAGLQGGAVAQGQSTLVGMGAPGDGHGDLAMKIDAGLADLVLSIRTGEFLGDGMYRGPVHPALNDPGDRVHVHRSGSHADAEVQLGQPLQGVDESGDTVGAGAQQAVGADAGVEFVETEGAGAGGIGGLEVAGRFASNLPQVGLGQGPNFRD